MKLPAKHSEVILKTAYEVVAGVFLGVQPGRPNGNSRRERADKLIVRTGPNMIAHVPMDDVTELVEAL